MSGSSRSGTIFEESYKSFENAPTEGDLNFPTLYSDVMRIAEEETSLVVAINSLEDSNLQVMPQGSVDGKDGHWVDLLNTDARFDYALLDPLINKSNGALAVTDPWPFIRVRVQTANDDYDDNSTPTAGSVLIQWSSKRSRLNVV